MELKIKRKNDKRILILLVIFLGLGRYYFGPLSFLSYLIALIFVKYKLKINDWLLFISLCFLFIKSVLDLGISNGLLVFGFHWGFICYYLFFKEFQIFFNTRIIFYILSFITILEGVLVNTIVDAKSLPNYPLAEATTHFSSIWQRSYSFGGNASVTGVLIITLLTLLPFSKFRLFLASVVMAFSASASGVISFFIYLGLNLKKFWRWSYLILIFFVGIIFYFLILKFSGEIGYFSKLSIDYFTFLFNQKVGRAIDSINSMTFIQHLFGSLNAIDTGGDFSFVNFYRCHGISGLVIIGYFIIRNLSSKNRLPILLMVLFTLHYHIIFSAPGQVILGYLLSLKKNKNLALNN